jgi:hypothetical protein
MNPIPNKKRNLSDTDSVEAVEYPSKKRTTIGNQLGGNNLFNSNSLTSSISGTIPIDSNDLTSLIASVLPIVQTSSIVSIAPTSPIANSPNINFGNTNPLVQNVKNIQRLCEIESNPLDINFNVMNELRSVFDKLKSLEELKNKLDSEIKNNTVEILNLCKKIL